MTCWSILIELRFDVGDLDMPGLEARRQQLVAEVERATGVLARTKTIDSSLLSLIEQPLGKFAATRPHAADLPVNGYRRRHG